MAISRASQKLRGAFSRGAGFGVARRLLRGFSIDALTGWLTRAFGTFSERELLELVEHGRQMRMAGDALTNLGPGATLALDNVPVNPWASPSIYEGARVVSELIVPWQIQGTEQEGEWYHRFRHISVISVDQITEDIETWVADSEKDDESPELQEFLERQFSVGQFVGVGLERAF